MEENQKFILFITYDSWGYGKYITNALEKKHHNVKYINFYSFRYKYPNIFYKTFNFITKNLGIANLKYIHYNKIILNELQNIEKIDTSIYIKADFLSKKTIETINKKSNKSVLVIYDSINRYPKTKNRLSLFDKIFSFEKKDCEKYNLIFKTNFIYSLPDEAPAHYEYKVFNVSSFDKRFPMIKKIAKALYEMKVKTKILIFTQKKQKFPYLEYIKNPLSISEMHQFLKQSEIMLDVHRNRQQGLSFRVFESLGMKKKLITTNTDVVNYDFYNPQNIFVIENINQINIPNSFFETSYSEISENILSKYLINNWVDELMD